MKLKEALLALCEYEPRLIVRGGEVVAIQITLKIKAEATEDPDETFAEAG
jgi:hypothetical protein